MLGAQLHRGGEAGAAQAHKAAGLYRSEQAFLVGHDGRFHRRVNGLLAVRLDGHRRAEAAVGQTNVVHPGHSAGNAGVDVCADEAAGLADQGAHLNGVPLLHHRRAGRADVLLHGKDHLGGNGHFDRFHPGSSLLMRDAGAQRRAL